MTGPDRPRWPLPLPVATWALHLALPVLGLWLLLARPQLDVRWEHAGAHFWLVLGTAAVSLGLALRVNEQAGRHADARLVLVSLAFACAAGFLGLHALATPHVLLDGPSAAFDLATPFGLLAAGGLAYVSAFELGSDAACRVVHRRGRYLLVLLAALVTGTGMALLGPLTDPLPEPTATVVRILPAAFGTPLFAVAALMLFVVHRRRPGAVLLSVLTAYVLLAEALAATAVAPNWHASWWEWHVLMLLAFGLVAYSAHVQFHREGTRSGLFAGVALDSTVAAIRRDHAAALEALVDAMRTRHPTEWARARAGLAERFGLSERQLAVLADAAEALAADRDQIRRLGALVAIGERVSVVAGEDELLADAARLVRDVFDAGPVRLAVLRDDELVFAGPDEAVDTSGAGRCRARALDSGLPCEDLWGAVLPLTGQGAAGRGAGGAAVAGWSRRPRPRRAGVAGQPAVGRAGERPAL